MFQSAIYDMMNQGMSREEIVEYVQEVIESKNAVAQKEKAFQDARDAILKAIAAYEKLFENSQQIRVVGLDKAIQVYLNQCLPYEKKYIAEMGKKSVKTVVNDGAQIKQKPSSASKMNEDMVLQEFLSKIAKL